MVYRLNQKDLLGFILPLILFSFNSQVHARPVEAPEVCDVTDTTSCPPYTACYNNPEQEGGQCLCWRYYGLTEADDGDGCKIMPLSWPLGLLANVIVILSHLIALYHVILTIVRLYKASAFKNNCAGRMLIFMIAVNVFSIAHTTVFVLGYFRLDKDFFLYDFIRYILMFPQLLAMYGLIYECVIAWIDLAQKTVTMSRTSSKKLDYFRKAIRISLLLQASVTIYLYTTGMFTIGMQVQGVNLIILILTTKIGGAQLSKLLCPDMKNKEHGNYKPAEAIRRTYIFQVIALTGVLIFVVSLGFTIKILALGSFPMIVGSAAWQVIMAVSVYQWLSYVKVCCIILSFFFLFFFFFKIYLTP